MEAKNLDIYGHEPLPWSRVLEQLERTDYRATHWLATTGPDGRPHVAGVGAMWDGGKFYVVSGPGTRKSKNIAKNRNCVIAVSMPNVDLVMEGTAAQVSDDATLTRLAKRYAAQGWPAEARDGAITAPYSAPSAGPGPWDLYEFTPGTATAVATEEPHGATRWQLG
jgi:nitroimidazol reductase NimA-like FMN-containing flavoprotein (pyridoxamine 5'-phosphate oxidase superfamily)